MRPSFVGLVFGGLLIFIAVLWMAAVSSKLQSRDWIPLILLLSIAVSTHSMLHAHEERWYNFNPMRGQWAVRDDPVMA